MGPPFQERSTLSGRSACEVNRDAFHAAVLRKIEGRRGPPSHDRRPPGERRTSQATMPSSSHVATVHLERKQGIIDRAVKKRPAMTAPKAPPAHRTLNTSKPLKGPSLLQESRRWVFGPSPRGSGKGALPMLEAWKKDSAAGGLHGFLGFIALSRCWVFIIPK